MTCQESFFELSKLSSNIDAVLAKQVVVELSSSVFPRNRKGMVHYLPKEMARVQVHAT